MYRGRDNSVFLNHKSLQYLDAIAGLPFCAMSQSARRGASDMYGGSPSIISMAMMPRLQMSTFLP